MGSGLRRRPGPVASATVAAVWVVGAAVGLTGCDTGDGTDLEPPPPGATAPPTPTSEPAPAPAAEPAGAGDPAEPGVGSSVPLALVSEAFVDGGALPAEHTCDGEDLSPPLSWSGVPADAVELAVVVRDLDAGDRVHWAVAGIDPSVQGVGAGGIPEGAVEAANELGDVGWRGPCPPAGEVHRYRITLLALPTPSDLEPGAPGPEAAALLEGAATARAELTPTYGRPA